MSDTTATELLDGTRKLDEQERDLNTIEQVRGAQVTAYAKGSSGTSNQATIKFLSLSDPQPPLLQLMLAAQGQGAPAGTTKVFQSTVFVEGAEKIVIGFRQAAAAAGAKPPGGA